MTPKKLAHEIVDRLLYFYAHASEGDNDGMDIALTNLLDLLERELPEVATLRKNQRRLFSKGLKCPECDTWTWQELHLSKDGRSIVVYGDCEHEWTITI